MPHTNAFNSRGALASLVLALISITAVPWDGWSQTAAQGTVSGRVNNEATGLFLEGALVRVEGTNISVHTGRDGSYRLQSPAGSQTLVVSYTGLDTQQIPVSVRIGEAVQQNVAMSSPVYALEEFTVAGEREGSALAIQMQRMSTNVKNVVAADTFGNPDQNPGELIQRLPGISTDTVGGEVRHVQVRGLHQSFTSVMVDGNKAAVSGSSNLTREVQFEQMGTTNVERVELIKAPTPDMDADAIGGYVNLITGRAFDRPPGRRVSYTLGTVWKMRSDGLDASNRDLPGLDLLGIDYSDVLSVLGGENNLGLSIAATNRESYTLQNQITHLTRRTGAVTADDPVLQSEFGNREFTAPSNHYSLSVNVDYKLSETSYAYVRLNANRRFQNQIARTFRTTAGAAVGNYEPGWSWDYTRAKPVSGSFTEIDAWNFTKKSYNYQLTAGAEHDFNDGAWNLKYSAYQGYGTIWYPHNHRILAQVRGVGWEVDRRNTDQLYPEFNQYAGPDITDPDSYKITQLVNNDNKSDHRARGAKIDLQRNFDTAVPTYLKTGLVWGGERRVRDMFTHTYNYTGPEGIAPYIDPDQQTVHGDGRWGPWPTMQVPFTGRPGDVADSFRNDPQYWSRNHYTSIRDAFNRDATLEETITGAYIMGSIDFGKLRVLGGLRTEQTKTKGTSWTRVLTPEETAARKAWTGPVTEEEAQRRVNAEFPRQDTNRGEYRNVFPGVHFVSEPLDGLLLRASWNTSITRPATNSILPGFEINEELERVTLGNPDLKPHFSNNFEFSVEKYFEPIGMVGFGVFLKEIEDYSRVLVAEVPEGPDNGFDGQFAGWELRKRMNTGDARIRGFEVNYSQQFSFLPGFWRGFGMFANYTRLEAEGTFAGSSFQSRLGNMVPNSGNAGISFLNQGLDARVLLNWRGEHYRSGSGVNTLYWEDRKAVDVKLQYHINRKFSIFVDAINIFDVPSRAATREFGRKEFEHVQGVNFTAGIKGRL